nr:ribonuclease H-like domain-containing protein [Tanacetum cinerariifolium]
MTLPDKHQLKFNIHKDAKSLMEAIKKRLQKLISQLEILDLEEQSLDDLFNNLKIYEAEVNISSTTSHNTQNIAFVSSNNIDNTNESVYTVLNVFAASSKASVSTLLNMDSLSDAEMDLKWQMVMLTMRARRFLQKTGRNLGANGTTAIRSPRDNKNKDTPIRTVPVKVSTSNALVSQCDGVGSYDWSFQADEELTNYALIEFTSLGSSSSDNQVAPCSKACSNAYELIEARLVVCQQNENVFEEDIKLLKLDTSSKNQSKLLESQISDKTGLGYDSQVFDYEKLSSNESDDSVPTSPVNDRYKTGEGYHAVPPLYTRTFMLPKLDLVFNDAPTASEIVTNVVTIESTTNMPSKEMSKTLRPDAPIIEDWTSDSEDESELESVLKKKEPSFVQTSKHVKTPRPSVKNGNPQQALKDKGVTDSGCSRHMTGNISYLSDFEEFNEGYVAFGRNPKGGKISGKGKIKTGKLDFDDVYFVKELKFNIFSVS